MELRAIQTEGARRNHQRVFKQLGSADATVAADAFAEFARASDVDILAAAKSFDALKLRAFIASPNTPVERLGVPGVRVGRGGPVERDRDQDIDDTFGHSVIFGRFSAV